MNTSPTKQTHAFSKTERFPQIKSNTKNVSGTVVNMRSDFERSQRSGGSNSFGTTQGRFKYYNTSNVHGKLPSPSSYQTAMRTFSPEVSRSNGWSFGVSREKIMKLHIDKEVDQITKKLASPSPVNYNPQQTFGKAGIHYSMKIKMKRYGGRVDRRDDHYFEQEGKLPGPGYYAHPEIVGKSNAASVYHTARQSGFGSAKDRFNAPTKHKVLPAPGQYSPKASIDETVKSQHRKAVIAKFGMNQTQILDQQWDVTTQKKQPGPGHYESITEFQSPK